MGYIVGTNTEQGSLFAEDYERHALLFHSEYLACWSDLPDDAKHFETWMGADAFRHMLKTLCCVTEDLYIWEHHHKG